MRFERIAFLASAVEDAQEALIRLRHRYGSTPLEAADVVVALGGDGFMLDTLHRTMQSGLPVYGMNRGSVGFLMNEFEEDGLLRRLEKAEETQVHPLRMRATRITGETVEALAINEVSFLRQTRQAAKLRIRVDGAVRMEEVICDGAIVATPAGSTAYNLSAHGPILPVGSDLLALTPISAFRPRRWRGALLPGSATVVFDVLENAKRPVSAVADTVEVRDVRQVTVAADKNTVLKLLFDSGHNLDERIIREQFLT